MIIRVRRGLEANRTSYTPQVGEPTFTTDTKKLYIGDGVTPGGIMVDLSGGGIVQTIVGGTNVTVNSADPANPIVSAEGGEGDVASVNGQVGVVVLDADDISDASTTKKFATAAEKTKLGFIAVSQSVDLDAMETKLATIETSADVTDAGNVGSSIHGASAKTAPVDADTMPLIDSAASNVLKKVTWANIKATLKSYFDTLYQPIATVLTNTTASFTTALETKLNGIEAGADVTDAANVDAAGALMESELLYPADVKAFEAADFATSSQGLLADSAVQPIDLATVATTGVYSDLTGKPTIPTSVDDLSPSQTGHAGKFLKTDGTDASWEAIPGGGDALTSNPLSQFAVTTSLQLKGVLSDETGSGAAVFGTSPNITTPTGIVKGDVGLGNADNTSDATKQAATLLAAYPVGSIYINTSNTNPGTFIGGTWTAFGAGRVPVGFDSGDTDFDTDEETGGAKTVATNVTVATQPTFTVNSHTHPLSSSGWAKFGYIAGNPHARILNVTADSWTANIGLTATGANASAESGSTTRGLGLGGVTDATSGTATTRTADVALTNNATSVQQKYIVVRMWKRTA